MVIEIDKSNILLTKHKDNPLCLNIFGLIKNSNNYKLFSDFANSLCLIVNDLDTTCVLFGDNYIFFDEMLATFTTNVTFCGLADNVYLYLKNKYELTWTSECDLYVHNGEPVLPDKKFDIKEMDKKYWQDISDGTPYKAYKEEIFECLDNRFSSAIYMDGRPVCWCLMHHENSLGMLYTMPNYRRLGLAKEVMKDITSKIIASGEIPYAYIVKTNVASQNLAPQYNMYKYCSATWCGVELGN